MNTVKSEIHHNIDLRPASCRAIVVLFAALAVAAGASLASAQSGGGFDLGWSSIDGGGGQLSTGGGFEVLAVIGQPDAGVLIGGGYELEGGFLNYDTAQVPVELSVFMLD